MKFISSQRFLMIYSECLTAVFAVTVLCGFAHLGSKSFDEITVHRINVVEPDGTVRMVISDKANAPGFVHQEQRVHTFKSIRSGTAVFR